MSDQTTNLYSYNEGVKTNSCRGDLTPRINDAHFPREPDMAAADTPFRSTCIAKRGPLSNYDSFLSRYYGQLTSTHAT